MSNGQSGDPTQQPTHREIGKEQAAGWLDVTNLSRTSKWIVSAGQELIAKLIGVILEGGIKFMNYFAVALVRGEDKAQTAFGELAATAVEDVFGVRVDASSLNNRGGRGGRTNASRAIGAAVIQALTGATPGASAGAMEPGTAGAEAYISTVVQMGLEGWLEGWLVEACTLGQLETFGELDDIMAQALGLGRMSRRVIGPLLDARVVTPMEWHVNKTYRPSLLTAVGAARQIARHPEQREKWLEELRRQGYSDERIEALLNEQRKFFSASDVRTFTYRGHWDETRGLKHLMDQGYDQDTAQDAIRLEGLKRIEQLEDAEARAIIDAYVSGDIDGGTFRSMLKSAVTPDAERNLLLELAEVRRQVSIPRVTLSQVEAMVKSGVLNVRDYRARAEQAGYPPRDVDALELQLRWELDKEKQLAQHRAEQEAERKAEQAQRDAERAQRKADVDAERRLARRGPLGDLERAVIRGLIPVSRYAEVLRPDYDNDTVEILVALVEQDRAAYLDQQAQREAALQRAARRDLDVGAIERAVAEGVLTLDQYRERLGFMKFTAADADILVSTLRAHLADVAAAKTEHDRAEAEAKRRSIDLGRFESLVRRGLRTMAQYDALLQQLGFVDAARAAMVELLNAQIAEDARARQERADAEARLRVKGLSLEQYRRAVILGAKSIDQYATFLIDQGFTADAQIVLLAELRADVADADAARQRRQEAEAAKGTRALPLSTVARAAQLGIVSPDVYRARLERDGYTDEDVAIEMELLLTEIADIQAARAKRDALEQDALNKGASLATIERAVKLGVLGVEDYRARAAGLGFGVDAVALLVAVLEAELQEQADARARRADIEAELTPRNLSIAQLEDAVKSGLKSVAEFAADVEALGYTPEDAELLTALLVGELEAQGAA
jgi:hypothetical protein